LQYNHRLSAITCLVSDWVSGQPRWRVGGFVGHWWQTRVYTRFNTIEGMNPEAAVALLEKDNKVMQTAPAIPAR
jgi:hypothetical protein